jgi:hypothetical protein
VLLQIILDDIQCVFHGDVTKLENRQERPRYLARIIHKKSQPRSTH